MGGGVVGSLLVARDTLVWLAPSLGCVDCTSCCGVGGAAVGWVDAGGGWSTICDVMLSWIDTFPGL